MLNSRGIFALILLSLTSSYGFAADSSPKPVKWMRGIYIAESPVPTTVSAETILTSAQIVAQSVNGLVLRGSGESMQPLYAPGTVLVVAPVPYESLKRGQTVLYRRASAEPVAHVLIAKTGRGWRAAGLNNRLHDPIGVTAQNLFGVVVAAFAASSGNDVASQ